MMRRSPLRREGRIGKMQREWNTERRYEWARELGVVRCAVTGSLATVCGHIQDVSLRPDLRMVETNVAPISRSVNERMKYDLAYRKKAQAMMTDWNLRFMRLRKDKEA